MQGFYRTVGVHPDADAIIEADRTTTFGEAGQLVDRISNALLGRGLHPGDDVAMVLPNSCEALLVELAATQLPLYVTPINWHLAVPEMAYILADADSRLIVTHTRFAAEVRAAAAAAGRPAESVVVVGEDGPDGFDAFVATGGDGPPPGRQAGQRMLYTSGTTGHPKGVRRPLRDTEPEAGLALARQRVALYGIDHDGGTHLVTAPMYHAAPGAYALQALHLGHRVVVMDRWDAEQALELIERHRVTHTYMVPTMFAQLLDLPAERRRSADVTSLRSVLHTAAPCPPQVKHAMFDWLGPIIYEIYGGTEGGATVVAPDEWLARPGTVGRAREGVQLRILDTDGDDVPAGTPGAVYMAIPAQRFEYLNDTAKTEAARVGEFFTLGDIGYLDDDGYLFLCDRAADVIVAGGVNIYPAEVEAALLSHPDLADAAVIGAPHDRYGETVEAIVVARPGVVADATFEHDVIEHCRGRIAAFKCPRHVEFRDALPRSDVGKLLRRVLRDERWAGREGRL